MHRLLTFLRALWALFLGKRARAVHEEVFLSPESIVQRHDAANEEREPIRPRSLAGFVNVGVRRYFRDVRGVWWRVNHRDERGVLLVGRRHLYPVIDMQRVGRRIDHDAP